jgi:hypothetical protein
MNGLIMRALAASNDYMSFDELDHAVAAEAKHLKPEVRRSLLRGELGRMIQSGQIVRMKNFARYKISEETIDLFANNGGNQ